MSPRPSLPDPVGAVALTDAGRGDGDAAGGGEPVGEDALGTAASSVAARTGSKRRDEAPRMRRDVEPDAPRGGGLP